MAELVVHIVIVDQAAMHPWFYKDQSPGGCSSSKRVICSLWIFSSAIMVKK